MRNAIKVLIPLGGGKAPPIPLTIDFSTLADGALPTTLTGATWAIATGKAVNTPTEGDTILTDGGLEAWDSDTDLTSWTESISGTSTINKEASVIHGGSFAARFDVDASNSDLRILENISGPAVGEWYNIHAWAKASAAGKSVRLWPENGVKADYQLAITTTYTEYTCTFLLTSLVGAMIKIFYSLGDGTSASLYIDDVSCKKISLPTMFATMNANTSDVTVKAGWTIAEGGFAGVIHSLDDPADPKNFVIAIHTGSSNVIQMVKCVNGTYTTIAGPVAATYAAGANVEIRKSGTTYQLYYNKAQIGTDVTVSDAGVIGNTYHGMISTHSGNQAGNFFVGSGPEVINVPNGASIADYLPRVSTGDMLSLYPGGSYTLAVAENGFSTIVSGTSGHPTTIAGNGATVTGGAVGIMLSSKAFINVTDLTLVDQATIGVSAGHADDISFTNVSISNNTGGMLDAWKIRNCDRVTITGGTTTLVQPSTTLSCDGVEFWGPCNDCTVTNHTAIGFDNGDGDDNGHGFEVYGESVAEICDSIHFVGCVATNCQAGFSCEGGPSSDAEHTDVLCLNCSGSGNDLADYRGAEGATLYRTNSPGTTNGTVVDV